MKSSTKNMRQTMDSHGKVKASNLSWEKSCGDNNIHTSSLPKHTVNTEKMTTKTKTRNNLNVTADPSSGCEIYNSVTKGNGSATAETFPLKKNTGYSRLRDLCPQDKRRIKDLIEQIARLGSEKEKMASEMERERRALQGHLEDIQRQYWESVKEKRELEFELSSSQHNLQSLSTNSLPHADQYSSDHMTNVESQKSAVGHVNVRLTTRLTPSKHAGSSSICDKHQDNHATCVGEEWLKKLTSTLPTHESPTCRDGLLCGVGQFEDPSKVACQSSGVPLTHKGGDAHHHDMESFVDPGRCGQHPASLVSNANPLLGQHLSSISNANPHLGESSAVHGNVVVTQHPPSFETSKATLDCTSPHLILESSTVTGQTHDPSCLPTSRTTLNGTFSSSTLPSLSCHTQTQHPSCFGTSEPTPTEMSSVEIRPQSPHTPPGSYAHDKSPHPTYESSPKHLFEHGVTLNENVVACDGVRGGGVETRITESIDVSTQTLNCETKAIQTESDLVSCQSTQLTDSETDSSAENHVSKNSLPQSSDREVRSHDGDHGHEKMEEVFTSIRRQSRDRILRNECTTLSEKPALILPSLTKSGSVTTRNKELVLCSRYHQDSTSLSNQTVPMSLSPTTKTPNMEMGRDGCDNNIQRWRMISERDGSFIDDANMNGLLAQALNTHDGVDALAKLRDSTGQDRDRSHSLPLELTRSFNSSSHHEDLQGSRLVMKLTDEIPVEDKARVHFGSNHGESNHGDCLDVRKPVLSSCLKESTLRGETGHGAKDDDVDMEDSDMIENLFFII